MVLRQTIRFINTSVLIVVERWRIIVIIRETKQRGQRGHMTKYEREQRENVRHTAEVITSYVNGSNNNLPELIKELRRDHRTLQQGVTRMCVLWLEECGKMKDEGDFDGRNEASVNLGKAFVDLIPRDKTALPLI